MVENRSKDNGRKQSELAQGLIPLQLQIPPVIELSNALMTFSDHGPLFLLNTV